MQITGRTTLGNEAALFMETSGVVRDRLILNLPGYGPESCRSLSFCLSVWFLYFLSFLSICFFFPPSLFLALFLALYIFHALSSASCGFRISGLPLRLSLFPFFVSPHLALSFTCYGVKRLTDSGLTVSEMMRFAGGALLSIYLR